MAKKKKNDSNRNERKKSPSKSPGKAVGKSAVENNGDLNQAGQKSSMALLDFGLGSLVIGLLTAAPLVSEGAPEQFPNWVLFVLWLLVLAAMGARQLLQNETTGIRVGALDYCVYGVCLWVCLSGVVTLLTETGHARPTINATWQWFGYAVAFFVIRQLVAQKAFRNSVGSVLVFLAVGIAVAGIYQRYVVYPAVWQSYEDLSEDQKQNSMRNGGLSQVEKGSRERMMWENRLHATEPTSTFVLANSLAAYLTPWILITVGSLVSAFFPRQSKLVVTTLLALLPMVLCLILTKSRTAYLAVFLGLILVLFFWIRGQKKSMPWRLILGIAGVLVGMAIIAFVTGAVDRQVVTEAFKSLSYRLEYWQASWSMIQDHWLMGIGPGNFQHNYARYQLVEASETVSDPHNFFFEVWALGGTPAMLLLVLGMGIWLRTAMHSHTDSGESAHGEAGRLTSGPVSTHGKDEWNVVNFQGPIGLAIGAGLACFVSLLNGGDFGLIAMAGLIAVLCSLATLHLRTEWVSDHLSVVGLLCLGVALLASGGIGFPSVAMTGILLLALSPRERGTVVSVQANKVIYGVLLLVTVVCVFCFRATVIDPIRKADQHAQIGQVEAMNGRLEPAIDRLELAILADPYDGNFLFFKLQLLFRRFQMQPKLETVEEMGQIAQKSATVRPNNSKVTLESGKIFLSILMSGGELDQNIKERLELEALGLFEQSTSRRPNDALHAAYRALAYETVGDSSSAQEWAEKALDLDAQNPHQDKKLKNLPFRLDGYTSERDIEQELRKIRKPK